MKAATIGTTTPATMKGSFQGSIEQALHQTSDLARTTPQPWQQKHCQTNQDHDDPEDVIDEDRQDDPDNDQQY
jgi:hypothetical protein